MKLEIAGKNYRGETLWRVMDGHRKKIAPRMYVYVPAGYLSNLGTIPRWARWFISPSEGGFVEAFVLHDFLVNENHQEEGDPLNSGHSRWLADAILYELLCREEVPAVKRYFCWAAVRIYARLRGLK